ncbi:chaperonin 10-like protein [Aspergillus venezuelensis]
MYWGVFESKTWTEDDVDIEVTHCGICGSDIHMLRSGWCPTDYRYHEFVDTVGRRQECPKIGDRVGVGAQARSCMQADCPNCSIGQEGYCKRSNNNTYGHVFPKGGKAYSGYADYHRAHQHFTIKIPEDLDKMSKQAW